jgi:hypothetical protein
MPARPAALAIPGSRLTCRPARADHAGASRPGAYPPLGTRPVPGPATHHQAQTANQHHFSHAKISTARFTRRIWHRRSILAAIAARMLREGRVRHANGGSGQRRAWNTRGHARTTAPGRRQAGLRAGRGYVRRYDRRVAAGTSRWLGAVRGHRSASWPRALPVPGRAAPVPGRAAPVPGRAAPVPGRASGPDPAAADPLGAGHLARDAPPGTCDLTSGIVTMILVTRIRRRRCSAGPKMSDPRGTFEQTSKSNWTSERI